MQGSGVAWYQSWRHDLSCGGAGGEPYTAVGSLGKDPAVGRIERWLRSQAQSMIVLGEAMFPLVYYDTGTMSGKTR